MLIPKRHKLLDTLVLVTSNRVGALQVVHVVKNALKFLLNVLDLSESDLTIYNLRFFLITVLTHKPSTRKTTSRHNDRK